MKLEGKVVVVTGAGSGMGRELTLQMVQRGARVAAVDLDEESLEQTKSIATKNVENFVLNVTDQQAIKALPEKVIASFGQVDGLVNNAGIIQPFVKISELTREQAEKVMDVNFWGVFDLTKAFLPELTKRPEAQIMNISSMGAYAPVPGQSVYGASKAAVKLFTEGLRSELMDTNVGVTVVFPGSVATNIAENSGLEVPAGSDEQSQQFKPMPATDAAKQMLDAFESGKPRITVGKDATFMDRYSRLSPIGAANLIYKQMKSLLG
jgi:NADP-dependent 3-hydroxy acid dehydrogenase YdfG